MSEEIKQAEPTAETSRDCRKGRPLSAKGFTSLFLTLTFGAVASSGAILYLTPRGRVANWTDWTMLGLSKDEWAALHMNTCAVLVLVAAVHLALNWKMFAGYLYRKATGGLNLKREMSLAAALAAVLVVGTIRAWPPLDYLAGLNTRIKDSWETRTAEAPAPHAEELSLARFAAQINLPLDEIRVTLAEEGFTVDDAERTVGEIARQKGVAPSAVMAAIRKHHPDAAPAQGFGRGRGMRPGIGAGQQDSEGPAGEDAAAESRPSAGDGSGQGRGQGMGQGRGMGRGMGAGRGMGIGRGMGTGPDPE